MTEAIEARAFESVRTHARFADLVGLTRAVALRAATARALTWAPLVEVVPESDRGSLREEDAATDYGNAWTVLEQGPKTKDEAALVRALMAHVIAESRAGSTLEEDDLVARVLWLAAFTPFDATRLLDRALGDLDTPFWKALAERVSKIDAGDSPGAARAELLAGALALRGSSSAAAAKEGTRLATRLSDPAVAELFKTEDASTSLSLSGELVTPPRNPALTVALAVTGLLFVSSTFRLAAKLALGYRRPAEVTLTPASVRIQTRTLILGRQVRERDILVARLGLARAIREVRYPRAAFYAGLFFLALGSLLGVRTFIDGVRAASPSLLFYGLLLVAVGIGLDFLLGVIDRSRAGTCGVVFVNRDGSAVSVGGVDASVADRALAQLSRAASATGAA